MTRSHAAFLMSSNRLAGRARFFWTITAPGPTAVKQTRVRWNHLRTLLLRQYPGLQGLRVFELHEECGLHVHVATNRFLDAQKIRELAARAGWGRVHVQRRSPHFIRYIGKTLSRTRAECLRNWKLWAPFGKWTSTRVKDVVSDTLFSRTYRACKDWLNWTGSVGFFGRMDFVRRVMVATLEHDWPDGLGPGGRPYSDFDPYDPHSEFTQALRRTWA